jgi:hypothetical protein
MACDAAVVRWQEDENGEPLTRVAPRCPPPLAQYDPDDP